MLDIMQVVVSGLLVGAIYAMLALSFSLVFRVTGVVNLADGAFCIIAALASASLQSLCGWPLLPAILAAIAGTTVFGAAIGATTLVRALTRLSNTNILMLTAGVLGMLEGALLLIWGSQPYTLSPFNGERPIYIGGLRVPSQGVWIVAAMAVVLAGLWLLLTRTTLGRVLRACAQNPSAAALMGVDVRRMSVFSFGLAAGIAALSGVMVAPIMSVQFDTPTLFSVTAFIAMTVGGIGTLPGAVGGGLLLGVVGQVGAAYLSAMFSSAIAMLLLMLVLLLRPAGLFAPRWTQRSDVRTDIRAHIAIVRIPERVGWPLSLAGLALLIALPMLLPAAQAGLLSTFVVTFILFIAVMGLDVLMGYAGQGNLGQAGFMLLGGYGSAILATTYGVPPLPAMLASLALTVLVALLLAVMTMRLRGLYMALATLAFGLLMDSLAVGLTDLTGGPSGLIGVPSFAVAGFEVSGDRAMYYLVLGLAVVLLLLLTGLLRTGFGRALQAIRTDQLAAAALGINVPAHKVAAFAICAGLGSIAGSLYAFDLHFLSPDMVGMPLSLMLVTMLIVGGEGTLVGGLLGVAVLTLLPTIFQGLSDAKPLVAGLLLVLTFLYLPAGLYGSAVRAISIWRGAGRRPAEARVALERVVP